jgi:type IV pilus assembly protein PilW
MKRMRGFSLVELMVAMTLSLILMAGALSILYTSKLTYAENDRLARVQEAGRTTMEMILRDVRAAGFHGCGRPQPANFHNRLVGATTLLWNFLDPIQGFEAIGAGWSPALSAAVMPAATAGSDVLVLRTTRQGQPVFRTNAPTSDPTADISVSRSPAATVPDGQILLISDCEYSSVFESRGFAGAGATAQISHGAGGNPGNSDNSILASYPIDSIVTPIDTIIYYVRPSTSGNGPALWQKVGAANPLPLIEGVENLQVLYGLDTDGDLFVNNYVTAAVVDADPANWARVMSVSIAVLVRSENEEGVEQDGRTYNLLGTNLGPFNDRRQRSIFTTTVVLRNGAT